jgi:hypothetical protein
MMFPVVSAPGAYPEKHAIWPINGADKVAQEVKIRSWRFWVNGFLMLLLAFHT